MFDLQLQLAVVFFAKVYLKQVWEYYHQYVTRGVLHSRTSGDAEHSKLEEKLNRNEMKNGACTAAISWREVLIGCVRLLPLQCGCAHHSLTQPAISVCLSIDRSLSA